MNKWYPANRKEIEKMISIAESKMSSASFQVWELIRLSQPEKWKLNPWGNEGGGFWVVAIAGKTCLYYNDIEDGFNSSSFEKWGTIDQYFCDQVELQDIIDRFTLSCS